MGRCEFSARLFARIPPGRWRLIKFISRIAARYEASPSVVIVSGWRPVFLSSLRSSFIAAPLLRRFCSSTSSTSPSSSTARHSHMRLPPTFTTISSRCQRPVGLQRLRRRFQA
jgi:hypothetical protein